MARIVKEEEYAARRNEILDAAQRMIYTKGFVQMTIQDILDDLGISKGAFYHYFDSKHDLLEAIVVRMSGQAIELLIPIVRDPNLSALEKLQRYFDVAGRWKTARRDFLLKLLRVWYRDDNAIMRQRLLSEMTKLASPLFTEIVEQGIRERVFTTSYPDEMTGIIFMLSVNASEKIVDYVFASEANDKALQQVQQAINAWTDAIERVLGAPSHSLQLLDLGTLNEWAATAREALSQASPQKATEIEEKAERETQAA